MNAETTGTVDPGQTPANEAGQTEKPGGDRLATWSGIALVLGLAGDMAKPIGNYSLWLLIAGVVAFAACFLLRRANFARRAMLHSGIFALVMAAIWGLQQFATPDDRGEERGAAVAFLPFLAPIQTKLLPLPENQKLLMQFQDAIGGGSDSERVATARELYQGTEDSSLRRGMIETMMASNNAALSQSAILMRLAERRGDNLSLPPVNRDADGPLARRLLSYSFRIRDVDVDSGALELVGDGYYSDGTVSRQGATMQLNILFGDGRQLMLVDLTPAEGLRLTGTARLDSGETVPVELPLF